MTASFLMAQARKLDSLEKKDINRQQNKISRQIYRDKHNGNVQK